MFGLKGLWWFVLAAYWLSLVPLLTVMKLGGMLNLGWLELVIFVFPAFSVLSMICLAISSWRS